MRTAEELIGKIVAASRIPSGKRRREVARELRTHIEDFVLVARDAGRTDQEIEKLLIAHFGNPLEIAGEFAALYRRERAVLRFAVFLLSTLLAASLSAVAVLAIQAGLVLSLGPPASGLMASRHLTMELCYVVATAAAYVGLTSFEKLFDRARLEKAAAALAGCFSIAGVVMSFTLGHAETLILSFLSGILLRLIQVRLKHVAARAAAVVACFGVVGIISACQSAEGALLRISVWIALGICCHAMTHVAASVNRVLLSSVEAQG